MSVGDVDEALDYLSKVSQILRTENKVWAAQHILSLAVHLAQVRGYTLSNLVINLRLFNSHILLSVHYISSDLQLCISFNIL